VAAADKTQHSTALAAARQALANTSIHRLLSVHCERATAAAIEASSVVLGLQTRERAVFDQIRDVFDTDVQGTGRDDLGECRHRVLRSSKASIGLNARAAARRSSSAALTILSLG
jgi:hypothetical protein